MGLTVVGDSSQATVLAAAASRNAQETVVVVGGEGTGTRTLRCEGLGLDGEAHLERRPSPRPGDLVVVVAASVAHVLDLFGRYGPRADATDVVLVPGGAGGSLVAAARLIPAAGARAPCIAEVSGFPFLGDVGDDEVVFTARKDRLPVGGVEAGPTEQLAGVLGPYIPGIEPVDVLVTSLANTNHIVHPALALANLARIDHAETFLFYRDGISPAAMELVASIDAERVALTDQLGQKHCSAEEWFARFYAQQGLYGRDLYEQLSTFGPLAASPGPTDVGHRYLVDDVRYGLAVYEALGAALDIATPVTTAVVTASCLATGRDLRDEGPGLAQLLLAHHASRTVRLAAADTETGRVRTH